MSLQDKKITESERNQINVKSVQGSRLNGTVQENKNIFDRLVEFLTERYNNMIDELSRADDGSGAEAVGSAGIDGLNDPSDLSKPAKTVWGQIKALMLLLTGHTSCRDNPHEVTKAQVGLANADNTADRNKPISIAQQAALDLKLNANLAMDFIKDVRFDSDTGIFTFFQHDGTSFAIDTVLEKVPISCRLDGTDFVLKLEDGTEQRVSLASFVDVYGFVSTPTVKFIKALDSNNYTAEIPDGAVGREKLTPAVMEELIGLEQSARTKAETAETKAVQAANSAQIATMKSEEAMAAAQSAKKESDKSKTYAKEAQSWTIGGTALRADEDADNAKYYAEQAKAEADRATGTSVSIVLPAGRMAGDVDGDGFVTADDADWIMRHVAAPLEKGTIEFLAADVMGDGLVENSDATAAVRLSYDQNSLMDTRDVLGNWAFDPEIENPNKNYLFYVDIHINGITANCSAKVYLEPQTEVEFRAVANAQIYPIAKCLEGSIRIRTKYLPTTSVKATVKYFENGDGGGTIVNASFVRDARQIRALPISGGTLQGNLNMGKKRLIIDPYMNENNDPSFILGRSLRFNDSFSFVGHTDYDREMPIVNMKNCELNLTGGRLKIDSPAGATMASIVIPAGRMVGDANGDGMITEDDIITINDIMRGKLPKPLPGSIDYLVVDTNQSGNINDGDTNMIRAYLAGSYKFFCSKDVLENWTTREDLDDVTNDEVRYLFYTDVPVEEINANSSARVYLTPNSPEEYDAIRTCGMYPLAECVPGAIRIYTMRLPIVPIHAQVEFFSGTGGAVVVNSNIVSTAEDIQALPITGGKMKGTIDLDGRELILSHTSDDETDSPTSIQNNTMRFGNNFMLEGSTLSDGTIPVIFIAQSDVILIGGKLKADMFEGTTLAVTTIVSDSAQTTMGTTEKNVEAALLDLSARISALEASVSIR